MNEVPETDERVLGVGRQPESSGLHCIIWIQCLPNADKSYAIYEQAMCLKGLYGKSAKYWSGDKNYLCSVTLNMYNKLTNSRQTDFTLFYHIAKTRPI